MKYKQGKIKWSTWRELRGVFNGKRGESFNDYIERLTNELKKLSDGWQY